MGVLPMIPRVHGLEARATCQKLPRRNDRAEQDWDCPPWAPDPLDSVRGQSRFVGQTRPSMVGVLAEKRDSPRPFRERLPWHLSKVGPH